MKNTAPSQPLERRRPRHPNPEASESRIRQTAVANIAQHQSSGLHDKGVHQLRDRAVQRLIGAAWRSGDRKDVGTLPLVVQLFEALTTVI